jgi:hypothetical protein
VGVISSIYEKDMSGLLIVILAFVGLLGGSAGLILLPNEEKEDGWVLRGGRQVLALIVFVSLIVIILSVG